MQYAFVPKSQNWWDISNTAIFWFICKIDSCNVLTGSQWEVTINFNSNKQVISGVKINYL